MGSKSFVEMFGGLGLRETRTLQMLQTPPAGTPGHLPIDDYGFDEWYCVDPDCDCRRVLFLVFGHHAGGQLATISHWFDPPKKHAFVREQTFLDPLLPQSDMAEALLDLCKNNLLSDPDYCQRLERHYRMVKDAIADPNHSCQGMLDGSAREQAVREARARTILPPKRRGKRKWR